MFIEENSLTKSGRSILMNFENGCDVFIGQHYDSKLALVISNVDFEFLEAGKLKISLFFLRNFKQC